MSSNSDVEPRGELAQRDVEPRGELASPEGRNPPLHCITCSDEGKELTVLRVDPARAMALCEDDAGRRESVEVALVDCAVGDVLLVHAGTALIRVPAAAEATA